VSVTVAGSSKPSNAANSYLLYAFAAAAVWTRRYARGAEPRLRRGLRVAAVGLVGISLAGATFVANRDPLELAVPERLARQLTDALRAHAAGETAAPQAIPIAMPQDDGLDADVDRLVELSHAVQRTSA
jgi:hypothetical protein